MTDARREWLRGYGAALQDYLAGRGETASLRAYELGRQAMADGLGLMDLAAAHAESLASQLRGATSPEEGARLAKDTTDFLAEALAPFEMAQRGFIEANGTLLRLNQDLEQRVAAAVADLKRTQSKIVEQERLRALGQMASGIAHDFNNALAAVLGFSEMLLADPDRAVADRERLLRYLGNINTAAKDAAGVVRRLRDFYRSREANEVFQLIDLGRLVKEAVALTRPRWKSQAQAAGATIAVKTEFGPLPPTAGNEAELREGLTNLIFNAVDAMPQGGTITIRARVDPRGEGREGSAARAVLEVIDTGIGMDEETRRRCMEPFFTTKGLQGTGLGLPMVYGIVRRHDGTIDIDSEPGKGTKFTIRLPIRTESGTQSGSQPTQRIDRRLRVLVVEDEDRVREALIGYLAEDGHSVESATNGREGLQKFHAGWFDLVVTDRAMPEMGGDELAVAVKQAARNTPVLMVTGFGDVMQAQGERPPGVDTVISKPVTISALRAAVVKVMTGVAIRTDAHSDSAA
jgi:signal transduction histidine kinase/CheY-like chemotaxis protein